MTPSRSSAGPHYTVAGLTAAAEQTMRAVDRRAPVIYQAAMFDGRFVGFADFLVLSHSEAGTRYRLRDTKLARSVKVEALLQLAAYADTLAAAGVPVAPEVELVLGDGATASYRVDELLPVYLPRRAALQRLLDDHLAGGTAVTWEDDEVRACFRCPECAIQVRATDDLLLVAGMRVSQRARLIEADITTLTALAQHDGPVPELSARTVASLTKQARLQIAPRVDGKPPFEVADPQPLTLLPDPDKGDLFFDFEGDPLWTVDGREWGLEYMWGVLDVGGTFRPLWAHDRASERQALVDFLAMVRKRRKRYPKMHIYHYAAYEKSALLRLAGRYGVGEDEVDDLLRSGVLVDLFPLVRKSIRVGTENYSLKSLEPLYMGSELRTGDVTTRGGVDHHVRPILRAARRRPGRRSRQRAQGDRGLQPLRLPLDTQAARLVDQDRDRVERAATWPAAGRRRHRHRGHRRARPHVDGVRR